MAQLANVARFTISELNLNKVEPVTREDWQLINAYIAEVTGE
jgi:hypothetical protein